MDFIRAVKTAAMRGDQIRRPRFGRDAVRLIDGLIEFRRDDGRPTRKHLYFEDYIAKDWEVVDEDKELFFIYNLTFLQAVEAMKKRS